MGKVLKTVALIAIAVAVVYFAPQISAALASTFLSTTAAAAITSALVATAISAAISSTFSLFAGKPSAGSGGTPSVFRQTLGNSFIVYGKRRVGGLLIFFHPKGKDFRYFVIAVAGHRCKGVVRWFLGDEEVTVNGAGLVTSGKYANNAWLWFYRGTEDQVAHPTFVAECDGKWTAAHRGRSTALIYAKFKMTDDVVQAGMPNITAEIEGKDDILDPRDDTTGYTRLASLVFEDWMRLPREEGGFGAYDDETDWDWVAAQANVCDEDVAIPGGTEKRYEFDSYIQTGAAPSEVRDTFVVSCAGSFTYSGGKNLMRPGYYVPPSHSLKEEDLAGPITVPAMLAGDEYATEITGTYINPDTLYQPADVPTRAIAATDIRQKPVDLAHITSGYRGQRICEIFLRKAQGERRVTWPMNIMGIAVSTLDTVQLATSRYGLSNYAFQTVGWGLSQDFSVVLQLEEHNAEMFEDLSVADYLEPGDLPELDRADPIGDAGANQIAIATSFPIGLAIAASRDAGDVAVATTGPTLPAGVTLTRASVGTYRDTAGALQTAAADVARFDHDPVTPFASRGLLVEPARTNSILQTGALTSATWVKSATTAPDNTTVVESTAAAGHYVTQNSQSFVAGITYTVPFEVAELAGSAKRYAQINLSGTAFGSNRRAVFDLAAATFTVTAGATAAMESLGGGRWRIWITATASTTVTGNALARLYVSNSYTSAATPSHTGDGVSGLRVYHGQIEDGPTPTSRIDTTTAPVTRAADVVTIDWASRDVPNGARTIRYTFDDGSTQDVAATIASGSATVSTNLNRHRIKVATALLVPGYGTTATITISDETRRYTDGHPDVAVTGGSISAALAAGETRSIAYDDPDRAGGAVTYQLFANDVDAHTSPAHPGRHYVGYATIPADGDPPVTGGGGNPPGGYSPPPIPPGTALP